eukprot:TRINITY_DN6369_c0_g1_i1.p1 TRINITY_DN6369_c0_g1~~TRINITY_DN6369_c0_g1_i1.p1  ORF type:complete len:531 (+),score=92.31 TRINITY_DN6369_c0_g1_i1:98-1594(+)
MLRSVLLAAAAAGSARVYDSVELISGSCEIHENRSCWSTPNYPWAYGPPNVSCELRFTRLAVLNCREFATEAGHDTVTLDGKDYSGSGDGFNRSTVRQNTRLYFSTDHNLPHHGVYCCQEERPSYVGSLPTTPPTKTPSNSPTAVPSPFPSGSPTARPNTAEPSLVPSGPTSSPSLSPSADCRLTQWNIKYDEPVFAGEHFPGMVPGNGFQPVGTLLNIEGDCRDGSDGLMVHVRVNNVTREQRTYSIGCGGRFELWRCALPQTETPTGTPSHGPVISAPTASPSPLPSKHPSGSPSPHDTQTPTSGPTSEWGCALRPDQASPGMRVLRGTDWVFDDQDGGRLYHGTLVREFVHPNKNHTCRHGQEWQVRWWIGGGGERLGVYPVGCNNKYALRHEHCGPRGTVGPSAGPTPAPSAPPTARPSLAPSTARPTGAPTRRPSAWPSVAPLTGFPTRFPSGFPTRSLRGTGYPTGWPTGFPLLRGSAARTAYPREGSDGAP